MFYDSDALDSTIEEGNKQQWTVKGTKLLLELYKERKEKTRTRTRTLMHTSDFFESTFEGDSFFEETNSSYSSSYSSSSSSSVAAEHSFSESESTLGSFPNSSDNATPSTQRQRRKITSKDTYDLRKKLLLVEKERVETMTELKKSIDDNNRIQQERNDLLKKLLEKM